MKTIYELCAHRSAYSVLHKLAVPSAQNISPITKNYEGQGKK